jgi:hypothetical protein
MTRAMCSVAVIVLGQTIGSGQGRPNNPDHVLDLLVNPPSVQTMSAEDRDLRHWMPPPAPAHFGPAPTFPFEVTLLAPDRMGYAIDEPMTFDVLLRNTSREPIDFPWSPDGAAFSPTMAGARRIEFILTFTHPVLGSQDFASHTVFGADAVAGSLRTIQPNETLLIRAGGLVQLHRSWTGSLEKNWAHNVKIKASVIFAVPSRYYPPGISHNEVSVRLTSK